jgi:glycosyltransferase involved in cell wall biosynthesis
MDDAPSHTKIALVLWSGRVGGAETLNIGLAERLRCLGANVTVVFIETPWPLAERLSCAGVPYSSLALARGRDILRHPRRYAAEVARAGSNGALLLECGYIGATLRAAGYREPIVAVEHGALLLDLHVLSGPRRLLRRINRVSGAWADDAEVAVSDFMLGQVRRHAHARRLQRIYNGIDPDRYVPVGLAVGRGNSLVVGSAGRLIPGKGTDHLVRAIAKAGECIPAKLLIAGDGPEQARLRSLAQDLGADSRVEFVGLIDDVQAFWQRCNVAAIPPDTFIESFSMVTLEAMACGQPIVATRNGAIPELVVNGVTGTVVPPGDASALTRALVSYAEQPERRLAHGTAARARAIERFHIEDCARAYLDLFGELSEIRRGRR